MVLSIYFYPITYNTEHKHNLMFMSTYVKRVTAVNYVVATSPRPQHNYSVNEVVIYGCYGLCIVGLRQFEVTGFNLIVRKKLLAQVEVCVG